MADNVAVTSGAGTNIAADDIGGVNFQRVKIVVGADGTNDGDVATTNPIPATITTGTVDVVAMPVLSATNVTVASITTGTVNVVNVLSATGVVVANVTTGTVNVVNVLSATGVLVASLATGTVDVVAMPVVTVSTVSDVLSLATGTVDVVAMPVVTVSTVSDVLSLATGTVDVVSMPVVSATGVLLSATTAGIGNVVSTAHAEHIQSFIIATTSAAAGVIIVTSGAHTIYLTDLLLSVDGPKDVTLASEITALGKVYLATKGGFTFPMAEPLVMTTAHSFRVILSSSGNCAVTAIGYTVT